MCLMNTYSWHWIRIVDESCHKWICDLVNLCIGEIWWMSWLCGLVYMYIGGFGWWLWIFELDSNCVSYLLVFIHLVNIFDDNYFGNSNEVRFVYVCIYVWCSDSFDNDNFLLIPLKWWIVLVELSMLNEE